MIVNLRGTSGSGKSFIVRELMKRYGGVHKVTVPYRKQPIAYVCSPAELFPENNKSPLFVIGQYETACGGADSISDGLDYIYEMIEKAAADGKDVIFEGLVVASDVLRCVNLKERYPLLVIELSTPIDMCLESIKLRRMERATRTGKEVKPLNSKNTIAKAKQLVPQRIRFKNAGVDFRHLNRFDALNATLKAFGWPECQSEESSPVPEVASATSPITTEETGDLFAKDSTN